MNTNSEPRLIFGIAICVTIAAGVPVAASDSPSLDDLGFLEGRWAASSGPVEMEEIWTGLKGGVMLGLHRDVAPGSSAFFEYLRIENRDDQVVYIASPRGVGTTSFVLVSLDGQLVVFENLDHDFPQRIIYQRDGHRLTARVEGTVDGKLQSKEWSWELAE